VIEPDAAGSGDRARAAQAHRQSRRLRLLPTGAAAHLHEHAGGQPRGAAAARAGPGTRPGLRRGARARGLVPPAGVPARLGRRRRARATRSR
jgi:hypothetical protein